MSKTIWRRGPWKVEKISHQQQGILALVSIEKKNMVISLIYSFTCLNLHISFIPKICIVKWNSHDMYCISKGLFYVLQDLLWLAKKITSQASIIEISAQSAKLSFFTADRSASRRHSGRKNKCFHKKPTKQGFSKKPSYVIVLSWFFTSREAHNRIWVEVLLKV